MQKVYMIFRLQAIVLSVYTITTFTSCKEKPANNEFEFQYYPETNVYFDVANKNYFYSLDSGRTWNNYIPLSEKDPGSMGKKILVYSTHPDIWKENEQHRKQYAGSLFNVINANLSTPENKPAAIIVSERKVSKKVSKVPKDGGNDDKREKKTVKEFFNDLFKKKKD